MEWAPGASKGTLVAGNQTQGSALNELNGPTGLFVDGQGNIYVADVGNNRIVKWAPGASQGVMVAGTGYLGSDLNELDYPNDVCLDANGNIYVADTNNNRVMEFPAQ